MASDGSHRPSTSKTIATPLFWLSSQHILTTACRRQRRRSFLWVAPDFPLSDHSESLQYAVSHSILVDQRQRIISPSRFSTFTHRTMGQVQVPDPDIGTTASGDGSTTITAYDSRPLLLCDYYSSNSTAQYSIPANVRCRRVTVARPRPRVSCINATIWFQRDFPFLKTALEAEV